jgi:hypothetical protein
MGRLLAPAGPHVEGGQKGVPLHVGLHDELAVVDDGPAAEASLRLGDGEEGRLEQTRVLTGGD